MSSRATTEQRGMLPNLFILGAAKAGTTALYTYLAQHPDIFMSPDKEPGFFIWKSREYDVQGPGVERIRNRPIRDLASYKMSAIAREGRTVLFVSHNMGAINALCDRAIWIDHGRIVQSGPTEEATEAYTRRQKTVAGGEDRIGYTLNVDLIESQPDKGMRIADVRLSNPESPNIGARTGEPLTIDVEYASEKDFMSPAFIVRFRDLYGMELIRLATMPMSGYEIDRLHKRGRVRLSIPKLPFVAGRYLMDVDFVRSGMSPIIQLEHVVEFDVEPADYYGTGRPLDRSKGLLVLDHVWNHSPLDRPVEADLRI
ncbi:MAG: Wzt carbohydrate-binding domain-containing protein [bacterium]